MLIRLGVPASFPRFTAAAAEIGAPILVSANGLRRKDGAFRAIAPDLFNGCNVALDSAGFVAMALYRGYPWSIADYVALANSHSWAWWASMDFCCEPEIAPLRETVMQRVAQTVHRLKECQIEAGLYGTCPPPMPVLQGWKPSDYVRCYDWMQPLPLPDLLGVGSVCRRPLGGPDGLLTIIARLDRELPPNKKLHLFGVKGAAIGELAGHPRIHSVDSMAWDAAARREKGDQSSSVEYRIGHLKRWWSTNREMLTRPQLRMAV